VKLYFAPDTCSLSPHIVLRELGLPFELVRVDNKTKKLLNGGDYLAINPNGYVAALELDNGAVLTEGPAIVQFLADLKPEGGLAPPNGTFARARLQEWLNFITSEIHAGSSPLFNVAIPEAVKAIFKERLLRRLDHAESTLAAQSYLMGDRFGIADAYLFTVLRWMKFFSIDLEHWPSIASFVEHIGSRPTVRAALEAEGSSLAP